MTPARLIFALGAAALLATLARPEAAVARDQRLIVIGPTLAEIVVALGDAETVVLRDAGADHIADLAHAKRLGGYSQPSAEGMLSVAPTLALMTARRTKPIVKQQLEAAGVEVHLFDGLRGLEQVPERVRTIAGLLGRATEAESVIASFETDLAEALALVAQARTTPRGLFLLSGGGRPTVVAGGDTHIASLIRFAGAINVSDDFSSFKPMSQEAMLAAAPDFILVNEDGLIEVDGGKPALQAPGVRLTPAARDSQVFSLPSGYLTDLGLATPKAITLIARRIHPELR